MSENNLRLWDKCKTPPADVLKPFNNGRFKGTDISPQWRLQCMTELFGPVGIGWRQTIIKTWTVDVPVTGEIVAFMEITVQYKDGENWSEPIPATGGSMLVAKEKNGLHVSDEAFKMANTDALGVAVKQIGVASDVYYGRCDDSKNSIVRKGTNTLSPGQYKWLNDLASKSGKHVDVMKAIEKKFAVKDIRDILGADFSEAKELIEGF